MLLLVKQFTANARRGYRANHNAGAPLVDHNSPAWDGGTMIDEYAAANHDDRGNPSPLYVFYLVAAIFMGVAAVKFKRRRAQHAPN